MAFQATRPALGRALHSSKDAAAAGLRYKFGRNPVYLPSFEISLLYDKSLPPKEAKFHVPLNFSKFDLHDYLYHAYGLKCKNIRSWVVMSKPSREPEQIGDFNVSKEKPGQWHRPPSNKYMIVEMHEPFLWPKAPKVKDEQGKETRDFTTWGKQLAKDDNPTQRREQEMEKEKHVLTVRQQAQQLLEGKKQWKPTWMELQEAQRRT